MSTNNQNNAISAMPAAGEPMTHVACGVPASGGWMYLQPAQVALSPTKFNYYLHRQSIGLGVAQVVLGGLCIVFNIVSLAIGSQYYIELGYVGHGFWCGVMFIITGAFGISAGVKKTKCKIVSYMVLCIISASFTAGLLACGIIGAFLNGNYNLDRCRSRDYGYDTSYRYYYTPPCSEATALVVMESLLALCALIAAILFIWGSALCCKAKPCCCTSYSNSVQQIAMPLNYGFNNGQQVMQPAQFILPTMPYQPGMPPAYHYQPSPAQALWNQPQLMQGNGAAAVDPHPTVNPTQAFGQGGAEQDSQLPSKY